jgi:hypothetical protein
MARSAHAAYIKAAEVGPVNLGSRGGTCTVLEATSVATAASALATANSAQGDIELLASHAYDASLMSSKCVVNCCVGMPTTVRCCNYSIVCSWWLQYFNMKPVVVDVGPDMRMSGESMRSLHAAPAPCMGLRAPTHLLRPLLQLREAVIFVTSLGPHVFLSCDSYLEDVLADLGW